MVAPQFLETTLLFLQAPRRLAEGPRCVALALSSQVVGQSVAAALSSRSPSTQISPQAALVIKGQYVKKT